MNVPMSLAFNNRLIALGLLGCVMFSVISAQAFAADDELASVEYLPLDKFDEYLPADTLPYPWHTVGQLSNDLQVLVQSGAESPFTGNRYSGKGVEIFDRSATDGQGIGFGATFTQPPTGPIMLVFDYQTTRRTGDPNSMELACNLGRGMEHRLQMLSSIKDGLRVKTADGSWLKLADCQINTWYHVTIIGSTQSPQIKVSVTPHVNEKKVGFRSIAEQKPYQDVDLAAPLGQPTDVAFTSVAQASAMGHWNIDNVVIAGDVVASRRRWWPFVPDMSKADTKKKVLAYYYPPFSAGRSGSDPTLGWNFWQLQNLASDLDPRRRDAGCKMQYIPIPRVPQLGLDKYQAKALEMSEEVKLAQMMNLDGFIVDFNLNPAGGWNWFNMMGEKMLDAAAQTNGKVMVLPAVYSNGGASGVHGEADAGSPVENYVTHEQLLKVLKHPAAMHTPDGRVLLSMWLTERHSPKWWTDVLENLKQQGIPTALFTQFNSYGEIANFSKVAYGMGHWGPRAPREYGWYEAARQYTDVLAYPICAQDVRSRGASLVEACNSQTIRKLWDDAIAKNVDWAVIDTWSDYSEQAQMPSTAIGFGLYDLNAYYTQWFKTGRQPAIVRDVLIYCYRRQHTDAPQMHGVRWAFGKENDDVQNNIEMIAFLKEPGTLLIRTADNQEHRMQAPAGITSFMVPLPKDKRFVPYFAVERQGSQTLGGNGRYTIYDQVDWPNLLYHYGVIVK